MYAILLIAIEEEMFGDRSVKTKVQPLFSTKAPDARRDDGRLPESTQNRSGSRQRSE
jgi:hypothetical protein